MVSSRGINALRVRDDVPGGDHREDESQGHDSPWPPASTSELENGLPLFLTQLAETLRWEDTDTPFSQRAIGDSATRHGRDLRALGFAVSQVVHDYGDISQAITELAVEQNLQITAGEFRILNRCLDTAIADAESHRLR